MGACDFLSAIFLFFMKHPLISCLFISVVAAFVAVVGCNTSTKKKDHATTVARFFLEASEGDAFASVTLPVSGVKIAINNKPVITEYDFTGVQLAESDLGKFLVFSLTGDAARDVYRVTGTNQGKRLVLFINDKPVGARIIDKVFNTGAISVFAAIPEELLPELTKNLNATSADIQEQLEKAKK
ncbi:MAG: hypothetical protein K0R17_284 [Rariglobus sp.]|jgi:hypothetical protein|nr:hypothetical protein [Rariglobus sp.]